MSISNVQKSVSELISFLTSGDTQQRIISYKDGLYNPYREINQILNRIFYSATSMESFSDYIVSQLGQDTGYYMQCYCRDLVLGCILYWLTAGLWHICIYWVLGDRLFTKNKRPLPSSETIFDQMKLAQASMFAYVSLPILSEYLIESKFTKTYFYLDEIGGWPYYILYLFLYLCFVEVGIYWMHRSLHENKFLYKYVHGLHHKYNKAQTLTPWASVAFNPLDGLLQACPYVIGLFFVPVHYFTHVFLLFFSAVWATNIHDATWGDTEPIMGSKYHTLHHTHYHYNYGQFFIFCDYIFGTLRPPLKEKFVQE
eukprot:gene5393-7476_t